VNWEANFLSERHFRKEADAKVATLTAQLAEAREYGEVRERRRHELAGEVMDLSRQLAEVTKERDAVEVEFALQEKLTDALEARNEELRTRLRTAEAQLATAKREGQEEMAAGLLYIWRNVPVGGDAFHELLKAIRDYQNAPATPSGQWCIRCGDTCKPWCHNATPSPEAREVPSDIVLPVEESMNGRWMWRNDFRAVITPADAKRIMDMAQRNI
jgi:rubrerythrin